MICGSYLFLAFWWLQWHWLIASRNYISFPFYSIFREAFQISCKATTHHRYKLLTISKSWIDANLCWQFRNGRNGRSGICGKSGINWRRWRSGNGELKWYCIYRSESWEVLKKWEDLNMWKESIKWLKWEEWK